MRRHEPYDDIDPDTLIARDWLALSRSRLANERTLLAYIRTAVALAGLGAIVAAMKHLAPQRALVLAGLTPAVEKVFTLTRMDTVFGIFHTLDAALIAHRG